MTRVDLKKAIAAYHAEKDRWVLRYNSMTKPEGYEAVRNDEPDPTVISECRTITKFPRLGFPAAERRFSKLMETAALNAAFATIQQVKK